MWQGKQNKLSKSTASTHLHHLQHAHAGRQGGHAYPKNHALQSEYTSSLKKCQAHLHHLQHAHAARAARRDEERQQQRGLDLQHID